jgi:hypothetical protein
LEGGPPIFRQDGSCPALLTDTGPGFPYGAVTRCGPPFQTLPVPKTAATGLFRVRSPLLTESRLMSVPPATEMFQFAGFASRAYRFGAGYPRVEPTGGLPHSETPGSPIARISPGLFAACRVLPRLSVPRHPPDALLLRSPAPPHPGHPVGRTAHHRRAQRPAPAPPPTRQRPAGGQGAAPFHKDTSTDPAARFARAPRGSASVTRQLPLHPEKQHHPGPLARPGETSPRPNAPESPPVIAAPAGGARWWRCPLVEVNGIEPMTSCLQSRRSPN